jgi:HK97 family phage major capsid protein
MSEKLALLNEELEQVTAQRTTLRAKHKGATMPKDDATEDDSLVNRAMEIAKSIEIEKLHVRDVQMENLNRYMEEPVSPIRHAINDSDDSRASLMKAGWDIQNGIVMRETAINGKPIEFCPEEVLFGPIPGEDAAQAAYFKQTRAIFKTDYRNAYRKWLRSPYHGEGADGAALHALGQERMALQEGQSDLGGFLVPPDVQAEMLQRMAQTAVMRRLGRVVPTSRDKLEWSAVQGASSNGTIYSSGFVGTIVGEAAAFSETDPKFEKFEVSIKKFRTTTKLTNDFIADAATNILSWLAQNGSENLGLVEDYYFINGDGTGNQPLGLLNSGLSTTTVEGSTSDQISNTISNAGSAPLIDALPYLVPAQYVRGASWLMARASEGKIRGLVDANGRQWWMPQQVAGGAGVTPAVLGGYTVENSDFMPVGGTNGNKVLAFGDFKNFIIGQRAAMATIVLRERFADEEKTGIIIVERAGGGLWNTDSMYLGIV